VILLSGESDLIVKSYRIPRNLLYTKEDEWIRIENDIAVIGITDYAQKKLKNIISIDLPDVNKKVSRGEVIATIESVKAVADVYAPLTGIIIDVNEVLRDTPEKMNHDPYGEGWIAKIKIEARDEIKHLLSPEEYAKKITESE